MSKYVTLVIPKEIEGQVMRFIESIGEQSTLADPGSRNRGEDPALVVTDESRQWTLPELEILHAGDAKSVRLFCEVLDLLADASPAPVSLATIEQHTGVPTQPMQNAFGRVTVWIQNRMGGDKRWPIYWPDNNSSKGWAMSESNAKLWKSLRP